MQSFYCSCTRSSIIFQPLCCQYFRPCISVDLNWLGVGDKKLQLHSFSYFPSLLNTSCTEALCHVSLQIFVSVFAYPIYLFSHFPLWFVFFVCISEENSGPWYAGAKQLQSFVDLPSFIHILSLIVSVQAPQFLLELQAVTLSKSCPVLPAPVSREEQFQQLQGYRPLLPKSEAAKSKDYNCNHPAYVLKQV